MANSKLISRRLVMLLLLPGALIALALLIFILTGFPRASASGLSLDKDEVSYRYRFGGDVITHVLQDVSVITEYRRPDVVDQVVFDLENGQFYVLNADILVDYRIASNSTIEKREAMNQLFNHYDPYLQAEKQGWHQEWVNEQYMKWAGRLPTDAEWLEALNELTRGVEHHQMERWIQYSPPALHHFVDTTFQTVFGRTPLDSEITPFYDLLINGESYSVVEKKLAESAEDER